MIEEQASKALRRFERLPKLHQGEEIEVDLVGLHFRPVRNEATLSALGLEIGATVSASLKIEPHRHTHVFAQGELAQRVLEWPNGQTLRARVRTVFGVVKSVQWTDEGTLVERNVESGVLLLAILAD